MTRFKNELLRKYVVGFLKRFKRLEEEWELEIWDRDEYVQTLQYLGIKPEQAKQVMMELKPKDYYKGAPWSKDKKGRAVCEFGTCVTGEEVYVKLGIDDDRKRVICISFHIPAYKIEYPLKAT